MSKGLKDLVTKTLHSRYEGVEQACVVDVTGLDVAAAEHVRKTLRGKNMRLMVVKNSMARRAFGDGPLAVLAGGMRGPCALVTGGDSVIDVAREMKSLAKEFPRLILKDGLLPGETELTPVGELAGMKGKLELLGDVAMLLASPGRSLAGCLSSPQSKIAGCLKAMADKE